MIGFKKNRWDNITRPYTEEDVFEYLEAGANHISIGSGWFNYFKMKTLIES